MKKRVARVCLAPLLPALRVPPAAAPAAAPEPEIYRFCGTPPYSGAAFRTACGRRAGPGETK